MRALANLRLLIRDIAAFFRHPHRLPAPLPWTRLTVLLLVAVIGIDLTVDTVLQLLLAEVDGNLADLPDVISYETGLAEDIFFLLIFAPLSEEAMFRGWMSGKRAALRFAAWGAAASAVLIFADNEIGWAYSVELSLLALGLFAVGLWQWLQTRAIDVQVPEWFDRHLPWLVWGSALAFGLTHLANYYPFDSPADVAIVLPETMGGLFLAYTRLRFGLRAAMLHHAAYNAVSLLTENLAY